MKQSLVRLAGTAAALILTSTMGQAGFMQVDNIVQCMQNNLVKQGAYRHLTATTSRPDGSTRETDIVLHWRAFQADNSELNFQVVGPSDLAGIAYLIKPTAEGLKAWLYLPALDSVRTVSADNLTEALWGTEFSYAQFRQLLGTLYNGNSTRLADEELDSRSVYVIETEPEKRQSNPLAVRSYVDKQSCVLLRSEYLGRDGELMQILSSNAAQLIEAKIDSSRIHLMPEYTMKNLKSGQQTILRAGKISLIGNRAADVFDPKHFYRPIDQNH